MFGPDVRFSETGAPYFVAHGFSSAVVPPDGVWEFLTVEREKDFRRVFWVSDSRRGAFYRGVMQRNGVKVARHRGKDVPGRVLEVGFAPHGVEFDPDHYIHQETDVVRLAEWRQMQREGRFASEIVSRCSYFQNDRGTYVFDLTATNGGAKDETIVTAMDGWPGLVAIMDGMQW